MASIESELRAEIVKWSKALYDRGYTSGSSGNISVKLDDGYLCTPTNSCLGFLNPDSLSKLDIEGRHTDGEAPTKELPLHMAFYSGRPRANAVVHLHSTFATILSCLSSTDREDAIPAITPYIAMRVGRVPVIPYSPPGSSDLAPLITEKAAYHAAFLLGNHGPVVAGTSLANAVFASEELEETAKLLVLANGLPISYLSSDDIALLNAKFNLK